VLLEGSSCARPGSGCRQDTCAIEQSKRAPNLTAVQALIKVLQLSSCAKGSRRLQAGLTVGELLLILLVAGVAVGGTVLAFLGLSDTQPTIEKPLKTTTPESSQP
jgi:hypothetical protein